MSEGWMMGNAQEVEWKVCVSPISQWGKEAYGDGLCVSKRSHSGKAPQFSGDDCSDRLRLGSDCSHNEPLNLKLQSLPSAPEERKVEKTPSDNQVNCTISNGESERNRTEAIQTSPLNLVKKCVDSHLSASSLDDRNSPVPNLSVFLTPRNEKGSSLSVTYSLPNIPQSLCRTPNASTVHRSFSEEKVVSNKKSKAVRRTKAVRKLNFDDDIYTSPVSGTIIKRLESGQSAEVTCGDIDPAYNVVEVTEEAKCELAKIENKIGEFVCRLCRMLFEDAFGLARHRCAMIIHVEYKCHECSKVFSCPANLASHQRWHKPRSSKQERVDGSTKNSAPEKFLSSTKQFTSSPKSEKDPKNLFECSICLSKFSSADSLNCHRSCHISSSPRTKLTVCHAPIFHPPVLLQNSVETLANVDCSRQSL